MLAAFIFNALAIMACFLAAGMTGLYGTAVQLDHFDELRGIHIHSMYTQVCLSVCVYKTFMCGQACVKVCACV